MEIHRNCTHRHPYYVCLDYLEYKYSAANYDSSCSVISAIFAYRNISAWSWKRKYYIKSRPLIAFTAEGDPIAVLPHAEALGQRNISRLSVDSLIQPSEDSLENVAEHATEFAV